jgi:inner membrane protein
MTAPNHITGGIVFTGLFCSFFSINIFASPVFISVTILGSLLPDIDHTKSWIGKSVYPIANGYHEIMDIEQLHILYFF